MLPPFSMEVCYQLPVLPLDRPVPQHVLSRRGAISFSSSSALFGCPNPRQLSQVRAPLALLPRGGGGKRPSAEILEGGAGKKKQKPKNIRAGPRGGKRDGFEKPTNQPNKPPEAAACKGFESSGAVRSGEREQKREVGRKIRPDSVQQMRFSVSGTRQAKLGTRERRTGATAGLCGIALCRSLLVARFYFC